MHKLQKKLKSIIENKWLMKKIVFTLVILAIYRLLIHIPVPFVDINTLMWQIWTNTDWWLWYFVMMLWW